MFQLFVVFHKKIYDECYKDIPQEILDKYFTFYAVNENIPKEYTKDKYKVVNEWELPYYNDQFQKKGYNENSAIYHVIKNKLHEPYKYVGFFQYDMVFTINSINTILNGIGETPTCFYLTACNYGYCAEETWNEPYVMEYLTSHYEHCYNKKFSRSYKNIYPLYNSYVIPVETYEKVMGWVSMFYNRVGAIVVQTHFGHIGGLYERIMAFAIGEENLNMIKLDINHDHGYKNSLSEPES
jgi:hypothetical protein